MNIQEKESRPKIGAWLAPSLMGLGLAALAWLAVGMAPLLLLLPLILAVAFALGLVAVLRSNTAEEAKTARGAGA